MRIKNFIQFINEAASAMKELSGQAIKTYYASGIKDGSIRAPKPSEATEFKEDYGSWNRWLISTEYYFYSEGKVVPNDRMKYDTYTGSKQKVTAEQQIRNFLHVMYEQGILERYMANEKEIVESSGNDSGLFDIYVTTSGTGTPEENSKVAKARAEWVQETMVKILQEFQISPKAGQYVKISPATARAIVMRGKTEYIQNFNDPRFVYPDPEHDLYKDRYLSIAIYDWKYAAPLPAIEIKPNEDFINLAAKTAYNAINGAGTGEDQIIQALESLKTREDAKEFLYAYSRLAQKDGENFFTALNSDNMFGENNELILNVNNILTKLGIPTITKDVGIFGTTLSIFLNGYLD
jgi:hypothetical protein